jgi:pilus assembly protein CpaC
MTIRNALAFALLAVAAPVTLAAPAFAQDQDSAGLHAGTLEVPLNKSQVVTADRPIGKAMIGSSEIADVVPISDRAIYVLGKKSGTTSLTLYDARNRVIAIMDVSVGPDVEGLRAQIRQVLPGERVDAKLSNGSILLTGLVSDPGAAAQIVQLAKAYAGENVINLMAVGSSRQVMLEVKFVEVDRQLGEKLGVSGFGLSNSGRFSGAIGEGAQLDNNGLKLGAITDQFGILTQAFTIGGLNLTGTLNALERRGLSKILAEPTLIAISGERASFLAGGEFPVPVLQSGNGGGGANSITVEYKPFGVSLSFTPTVLGDGAISLVIEPEVSSIDPSASITINGLVVPGLQTRRASTTVELRDGESFAIAGLIRRDFQTTVRQVPILGSIPIIGTLFRSSSFNRGETELLIVVTPRLVQPIRPDQVRLPTDRIADPKPIDVLLNGDGYRPQPLPPVPGAAQYPAPEAPSAKAPVGTSGAAELPSAASSQATAKKDNGYEY